MESLLREKQSGRRVEKSRNGSIGRCSTTIVMNKHVKATTPLKVSNLQRSGRFEAPLTPRESALANQVLDLRKKNVELMSLYTQSKKRAKDEAVKHSDEIQTLKGLLTAVWPCLDGRVELRLRERIEQIVNHGDSTHTCTTEHTEHISGRQNDGDATSHKLLEELKARNEKLVRDIDAFQSKLAVKEVQNQSLAQKVLTATCENDSLKRYLLFLQNARPTLPKKLHKVSEILPVDSANVGSEGDEDDINSLIQAKNLAKERERFTRSPVLVPGFIKSILKTTTVS